MDEVIAKRVITDVVVVAEKADCPKGYCVVPTKHSVNDTVEAETGFEIGIGLEGRPRKRFICIAYGLEQLDDEVLTDVKILGTCKKAPPQYTLLPKTRDTGEDVLQDRVMFLQIMKPSGYEWIIDSLVICPSKESQAQRRREDSGSYTRIGNISDSMTLYCKKRFIYLESASEKTSLSGPFCMPTEEECIESDGPKGGNTAKGETGCQTTLSKGKERKLSASLSDLSVDAEIDEQGDTDWQTVRTKGKGRRVSTRYSYPSIRVDEQRKEKTGMETDQTKGKGVKGSKRYSFPSMDNRVYEHGETGCQTTLSKGKERKLSASLSDLSVDAKIDEQGDTDWQTVRTKGKGRRVSKRYSYPSIRVDEQRKEETDMETVQTKGIGLKGSKRYSFPSMDNRVYKHDPDLSLHMSSSIDSCTKQVARISIAQAPPLPRGKTFHVFFSYRHCIHEREWVRGIIKRLESSHLNYKCCIDDRDFMPGQSIVDNIEQAIKESLRVAVVLTPEYMKSFWCKYEATVMRVPGCKANIIPLILKMCTIPNSLNGLTYITVSEDNDEWWESFLKALKGNIPYLPASKSEHIFVFHDVDSEEDMKRVEKLKAALELSDSSFRCISSGEDFVCGKSIKDNLHECAENAVITVFALSSKIPKEKWLKHWQDLNRKGIKLFPLKFDKFDLPEEFKNIVIFDATQDQEIWVSKLISKIRALIQ